MKRPVFAAVVGVLLVFMIAGAAFAEMADIKVGKGTLKVGGILQAGYTYNLEDEGNIDAFTLNRARVLMWGTIVPDKVKYFVQLEHKGGVGALDYKALFSYIPKTTICVGRFLPNFTLYMPYSTAKLEMINYPLTTQKYAMWRQVGLQSTTATEYVDFNVGIFNGADLKNNIGDNNDAKDFLLRATFKPPMEQAKINFGGYAWIGKAAVPTLLRTTTVTDTIPIENTDDDTLFIDQTTTETFPFLDETLKNDRFGGFALVDYESDQVKVHFRGEFVAAKMEAAVLGAGNVLEKVETKSQAFFAHLGIQPDPRFEFLVRYDKYDPNTDVDDDGIGWVTGGVNYYVDGLNSMFYLNYIHRMEEGDNEVDNDGILAQVQILF